MIKLEHLLYKSCPFCCTKVSMRDSTEYEDSGSVHETIKFHCGCMVTYSSLRAKAIEVTRLCPDRTEAKREIEKRDAAWNEILEFIKARNVDEWWKDQMYDQIKYHHQSIHKSNLPANLFKPTLE